QFTFIDNINGAFRTHHGNLRRWPCKVHIRPDMLGSHNTIGSAISFSSYDRYFRDSSFGEREKQLGAVLDDAAELLLRSGQKTGNIFKRDEWNIEGVAEAHEPCAFYGCIDIQHARQKGRLIGYDTHRAAIQTGQTNDDIFREMLVNLEEVAVVNNGVD